MNKPTTNDIIEQFYELLSANGTTTTLDVKNALRAKDFWVDQNEVSQAIRDWHVSGEHDVKDPTTELTFTFNGTFRTYSLTQAQDGEDDQASQSQSQPQAKKPQAIGDWAVSVYGSADAPVIFQNMTRNQAKARFAHDNDADYSKVKAVKA